MKSFLKKYRILLAATLLLAIFLCIRNFPGLPHAGTSQSFDAFVDQLFEDEVTANTMNLHFTLKNPKSAGIQTSEARLGSFPMHHKRMLSPKSMIFKSDCLLTKRALLTHKAS